MAGYGKYWAFIELVNGKFDGVSISIEVHHKELMTTLQARSVSGVKSFIHAMVELDMLTIDVLKPTSMILSIPILFELMDKNSKYNRKKNKSATLEVEVEVDKELDLELDKEGRDESPSESFEIPPDIYATLKVTMMYPDPVIEEVRKDAVLKYQADEKPDKNWKRFIVNYFKNEKEVIRNMAIEKGKVVKKPTANNQARDMAANIYTQVLRNGMHGLKATLLALDPIDIQALQKFGMASEIINCPNDFQATDIKNRLKAACEETIRENAQGAIA